MPSYWKQHKLSKQDVEVIMDACAPRDIWLLGIAIGATTNLPPSSFRTSYSSPQDIWITSKASVVRKIVTKLQHMFFEHPHSALDSSPISAHHHPPLPVHYLSEADFHRLSEHMLPVLNIFEVLQVPRLFPHLGNQFIAIAFEGYSIFALRAVPEEVYQAANREEGNSILCRMPIIAVGAVGAGVKEAEAEGCKRYAVLCDYGVLFSRAA
jgi:hypothetical protein